MVGTGLPVVWPSGRGAEVFVAIGAAQEACAFDRAADLIEKTLVAYPIRPFFGSAPMRLVAPVAAELARQHSSLEARLVQRRQWYEVLVAAGERSCSVSGDDAVLVAFGESKTQAFGRWPSLAEAVGAVCRWLERRVDLDELSRDPTVADFSRGTFSFDPD